MCTLYIQKCCQTSSSIKQPNPSTSSQCTLVCPTRYKRRFFLTTPDQVKKLILTLKTQDNHSYLQLMTPWRASWPILWGLQQLIESCRGLSQTELHRNSFPKIIVIEVAEA